MDDLYTARAANWQPALAGCEGAGVLDALADDLLKARAANRRLALLAVVGSYVLFCLRGSPSVRWPPPGSRLWLAVGGCAQPQATGTATTLPLISTKAPAWETITSPIRAAHTPAALGNTPPS